MANAKANVNIKIDASIKAHATQLFERMGLDQTTAIEMFYRQVIAERRLPFQPTVAPSLEERLFAAVHKKNIPIIELESDENGHAVVDKAQHPDVYDWLVNG